MSPQRQLVLLAHVAALVAKGRSQIIIATHSPILLTCPDAQILSFDGKAIDTTSLEETSHYQITKGILQNPASYWRHLASSEGEPPNGRDQTLAPSKARSPVKSRGRKGGW